MTEQEIAQVLEDATRALELATKRIAELVRERDDAYALYQAVAQERDHWYTTAMGGA